MMPFETYCKSKIYTYQYPYADKVNPILHSWIMRTADTWDKGTRKTAGWNVEDCYSHSPPKELKLVTDYISNLLRNLKKDAYTPVLPQMFPEASLQLRNLWGQYYNRGDFQESHFHVPYHWSFCYWVNTPRGSSPMVFTESKRKVSAKAGVVTLFPAYLWHHIPPNKCDERSVIVGNFYYELR
tara:strand:+ start:409 stop:957 length:549 start_codon:yes stop_codon:yes gene_type:complete